MSVPRVRGPTRQDELLLRHVGYIWSMKLIHVLVAASFNARRQDIWEARKESYELAGSTPACKTKMNDETIYRE